MRIDLNSDSGESFGSWTMGDDATMMQIVTSANIACGFHASDPTVLRATVHAAARHNVSVGAHVAYRDLPGFGRNFIDLPKKDLINAVIYQIGAIQAMAAVEGTTVRYVKPHGALYNAIVHHVDQAEAVAIAVAEVDPSLALLVMPRSEIERAAQARGIRTVVEAFADRAYTPEGTLLSRRIEGAVLHDPALITQRMVRLAQERCIEAVDGTLVPLAAESICVHGDTAGAVSIAAAVRKALEDAGVRLASFA